MSQLAPNDGSVVMASRDSSTSTARTKLARSAANAARSSSGPAFSRKYSSRRPGPATAAIIRRGEQFTAAVHYSYADGRAKSWSWRTRDGTVLNGREVVRCINSIDRGFRAIPGVHVRIDFPQDASREEQMLILMDYGLHRLFSDTAPSCEPDPFEAT